MFTGIIQNQARVTQKVSRGGQIYFTFRFLARESRPLAVGESIAVDGVCLTVARKGRQSFEADVMTETLASTTLGTLQQGDRVNIERSLRSGDAIGGHFVTGHVDGVGEIVRITKDGRNRTYTFRAPAFFRPFLSRKGSLAVDGVSLTLQSVRGREFRIGLVPHTLRETTLGGKRPGDTVNLEIDLILRYLNHLAAGHGQKGMRTRQRGLRLDFLRQQGF